MGLYGIQCQINKKLVISYRLKTQINLNLWANKRRKI